MSKYLLMSSATVIVRAGGAIWLNPFATVLFNMCGVLIVECFHPCCVVCLICWLFSSVFAITERRDMGLYELPLSMSL